ncbi:glycoside hydrolase family 65 protein [Bacillus sp. HMF5848]|uniref:glycoside hydrolase family 65 protein n=1 Tax=Bacillus sp. HMF5848 TaxID=2495421 RepID=UPI000F7B43D0|nr:glycosyl hydrolase family 65 protein [Bacillus sp. HMF5848]RSK26276.1 glycoside hydrolase family 65 protein [Bacillus sp. HMF5848]
MNEFMNPYVDWKIYENDFIPEKTKLHETIFAQGNGYIGMRGNFEEGLNSELEIKGTYINGFYESEIIKYGEIAYGYAEKSQTMLNVTNAMAISLYIEEEPFTMLEGSIISYKRELDMQHGVLRREVTYSTPSGKKVQIAIERLVSFTNKHLAAIRYEVTPLNFSGRIRFESELDGDVTNLVTEDDPRVGSGLHGRVLSVEEKRHDGTYVAIHQKTEQTKFDLVCSALHTFSANCEFKQVTKDLQVGVQAFANAKQDEPVILEKYISYVTSREESISPETLFEQGELVVGEASQKGFESLKEEQKQYLDTFWHSADIVIKGDDALQQGIRFNLFHLLQSVGKDGTTNIGAKGLTGEGYEGHYFWDTETYILPIFVYTKPEISRKLLEYRYKILDKARDRARTMGHSKGALFPWRTIGGEECSAYYPAGTAQYHINADVAFAIKRYYEATEDHDFMITMGAEMLFETARLWASLGSFIESKDGKFCINDVTGPDEYTAIVNNNFFTNSMAQENLQFAYDIAHWLMQEQPSYYADLMRKLAVKDDEIAIWKKAADDMYLPYDEKLGIHPQDDSFLAKEVWDFENTPKEKYPLLLHYHPLVIYRHQVLKQADVVLAQFLLSEKFTKEQKKRDYDYYEKITTHDSSLSKSIYGVIANEIGYAEEAYKFFMSTARMDLDNTQGNTKDGIHAANMAGTWMGVVNGFAGMRIHNGQLSFEPHLPKAWDELRFRVTFKGSLLEVAITHTDTTYKLIEGTALEITHNGEKKVVQ